LETVTFLNAKNNLEKITLNIYLMEIIYLRQYLNTPMHGNHQNIFPRGGGSQFSRVRGSQRSCLQTFLSILGLFLLIALEDSD
jgi:hypothetical protein